MSRLHEVIAVPPAEVYDPTPDLPELQELFSCQYLERQMATKHCLRRQLERQEGREPKTKEPIAGPPVHAHCASGTCRQGVEIRKLLAHIPARYCQVDGTAIIGAGDCPLCLGRAAAAQPPVTGLKRVEYSERIWSEKLPEPPFVPPRKVGKKQAEPKRVAEARVEPIQVAEQHQPQEEVMPSGVRATPCVECGSKGTRHIGDCSQGRMKSPAAIKKNPPAKKAEPTKRPANVTLDALDGLGVQDLLELRRAIDEHLRQRLTLVERERQELLDAVGQVERTAYGPESRT